MNNLARSPAPGETVLYALPHNLDAQGFYFHDADEFASMVTACRDRFGSPVEEFEIQCIDGDDAALFDACRIGQEDLGVWFGTVEALDGREKATLFYLVACAGYDLDDALDRIDTVVLFAGELIDAATKLFDDCYLDQIPESVRSYIDYEAFARDLRLGGEMVEFRFDGDTWTCTNAGEV